MKYVDICVALYDYQAPVDGEELSFNADDILYILDKDHPDWFKAQLKTPATQDSGPIGIVPSNYIEKATPIGTVKAIYDYEPQSVEEVAFKEDEILKVYEDDDPNWFVVEKSNGEIGLAPGNYVERCDDKKSSKVDEDKPLPPIKPSPTQTASTTTPTLARNDSALSWSVHEYDIQKQKKTKNKGNLLVGNGLLCYGSETDKSVPVRQFKIDQVDKVATDGKVVHIEMKDPDHTVFHFETASQSEAKGILTKVESSRSVSNTDTPQQQQQQKQQPEQQQQQQQATPVSAESIAKPTCEPRWAIALYAFKSEVAEETFLEEHEQVLAVDYATDQDWWTIEHKDGTSGLVPANYVKFQDEYEAELRQEEEKEAQEKKKREAEEKAKKEAQEKERLEKQRREEEEKRQKEMLALNRQKEMEEKERARQAEVERRRRMQEEAKQKEIEAKRQANFASTAIGSPQVSMGSPRRSQIPAPPPPTHTSPSPKQSTYTPPTLAPSQPVPESSSRHLDPNKPDPAKVRMWTDSTGAFKVEAQFLSCTNGKIRLFKTNGVKIDVPMGKMCAEDIQYIERETSMKLTEDKRDNIPLAHLSNSHFSWFDFFKRANLPHSACVEYAGNFDANKLTEQDVERLTHRKMKLLGMSEKHVQRIQRFIETEQPEPPSDDESKPRARGMGGMSNPTRPKVKKSVTFGGVSYIESTGYIDDEGDDYGGMNSREWQIEQDEILARQLQEQEQASESNSGGLHRRGTGRPTPSHSAPPNVNSSVLTPQQFEPLRPVPAPSSPSLQQQQQQQQPRGVSPLGAMSTTPQPPVTPPKNNNGFSDDAWTPRAGGSPSVQHTNTWNTTQHSSPAPVNAAPPRQRPTPQLSQQNTVDPQLLAKWGGSPGLAAANSRPVPPPPTGANAFASPMNQQRSVASLPTQSHSMSSLPTASSMQQHQPPQYSNSMASLPTMGGMQTPTLNNVYQQPTGNNFSSPSVLNNHSPAMYNQQQPSPSVVSLQSVLPTPLVPQATSSSFGTPQLQQAQATGRSWASATPQNPFGGGSVAGGVGMSSPSFQQTYNTGFVPQQATPNTPNTTTTIDPNDKYAVFKTINTSAPSVFNNSQQQQRNFFY